VDATPREIVVCQTDDGREPFTEWLDNLSPKTQGIIFNRVDRIEEGNFGDTRSVGDGITELKIDFGPGYRVYFGQIGNEVHLINGGSKGTQTRDIASAQKFWKDHA
jgi:putative addiction module killer protein